MNQVITDGGSPKEERRDCTVRALSIALNISYPEVYQEMKKRGRRKNCGCVLKTFISKDNNFLGRKLVQIKRSGTLGKFVESFPIGSYVVRVSGHAMAVRDGVILDMTHQSPLRRIKTAWEVK